jgi:hypothetical protein
MNMENRTTASSVHRLAAKLPALIQQDITMYCPGATRGETYTARVLGVNHIRLQISLPRCIAGNGYLRESTPIIANFIIGKTLYEAHGQYCADHRRSREVIIDGDIAPTTRRMHERTSLQIQGTVVPVSNLRLSRGQFADLTWKRCRTLDISGGGALVQIPFQSPTKAHFLLNLDVPGFDGPLFIFAQVQWGNICDYDNTQYLCGLSFVVREDLEKHFSKRTVSELPTLMLNFDRKKQKELDAFLTARAGASKQGDRNDRQQDER